MNRSAEFITGTADVGEVNKIGGAVSVWRNPGHVQVRTTVERLVERGPELFMDPTEEKGARDRALEDSVLLAEQSGLSADGACRLREILARLVGAFRRALRGDPPARVEPMRVQLKPGACAVKAKTK